MGRPTRRGSPNYPIEFKRSMAEAACAPGISVARLALEHGLNANMLFKWRRHYRAGRFGTPDPRHLLPAPQSVALLRVVEETPPVMATPTQDEASASFIELVLPQAVVRLHGEVDPARLRVVLACLGRRR